MKLLEITKKSQKRKQANSNIVKFSFLSLVIASVIAYTFATDFFPEKSKELIAHKKTYKPIIKKRDFALQKAIDIADIDAIREIIASSKAELKDYTKEKNRIIREDSFLGYTSFKFFLLGTSSSLFGFVISLFFLFFVIKYINNPFLKKYYLIVSFVFIVTAGHWLAWSLLDFSTSPERGFDFPASWYYTAIYVLPTLVFAAAYYLFKYANSIEEKLKNGIKLLIDYISVDLFYKRIKEEDKSEVLIENLEKYSELKNIIE